MADTDTLVPHYVETFVMDEDHPTGQCGFICSICRYDVSDGPCPDHAPTDVPGLRLVDCTKEPRHWLWVHDAEDYGCPCYQCLVNEQADRDAEARQCRHWPWRRWKATRWVCGQMYASGIASSGGTLSWGDGHSWCQSRLPHLRGKRVYILWVDRNTWNCWRSGHRRGEEVGFGFCGKCMPWPCCGAQTVAHLAGCREYPATVEAAAA